MTTTAAASVHPVDQKLPWGRTIIYAFQHVLAMYAGAVAVPLVLAGAVHLSTEELIYLINADLFTCGIATLVQSLSIRNFIGCFPVGIFQYLSNLFLIGCHILFLPFGDAFVDFPSGFVCHAHRVGLP